MGLLNKFIMVRLQFALVITICVLITSNHAFLSTDGLTECLKEAGLESKDAHKVTDPSHEKDFLSCAFKKQGVQEKDGKILYEKIKDYLSAYYKAEDVEFILKDCKDLTKNASEAAYLCNKCITQKIYELKDKNQSNKQ